MFGSSGNDMQARRGHGFVEVVQADHSSLTPLPRGAVLGFQVSNRVPCDHWLYCMEATNGLIKVGSTHQPDHRYDMLRAFAMRHHKAGLACRALWPLGAMTRRQAMKHEFIVHGQLRGRFGSSRDEWYRAPLADVLGVVRAYIACLDDANLIGLA